MKVKRCSTCKIEKPISSFSKCKSTKDGYNYGCKDCYKEYYEKNKERLSNYQANYYAENTEKVKTRVAKYSECNKETISKQQKLYNSSDSRKSKTKEYNLQYKNNNRDYLKEYHRNYRRNKRNTDELYNLKCRLSRRINTALKNKGFRKSNPTIAYIGCDILFFKQYIENNFLEGMGWFNRNDWQIDHIIPLACAKTREDVIRLNHWSNTRPLWAKDNLRKSDTMPSQEIIDMVEMIYECSMLNR